MGPLWALYVFHMRIESCMGCIWACWQGYSPQVNRCIAAVARLTRHLVCDESSTTQFLSTSTNIINMDDSTFARKTLRATSTRYRNNIVNRKLEYSKLLLSKLCARFAFQAQSPALRHFRRVVQRCFVMIQFPEDRWTVTCTEDTNFNNLIFYWPQTALFRLKEMRNAEVAWTRIRLFEGTKVFLRNSDRCLYTGIISCYASWYFRLCMSHCLACDVTMPDTSPESNEHVTILDDALAQGNKSELLMPRLRSVVHLATRKLNFLILAWYREHIWWSKMNQTSLFPLLSRQPKLESPCTATCSRVGNKISSVTYDPHETSDLIK